MSHTAREKSYLYLFIIFILKSSSQSTSVDLLSFNLYIYFHTLSGKSLKCAVNEQGVYHWEITSKFVSGSWWIGITLSYLDNGR